MNYDPREVSILVRDALLLKQQAEATRPETLIEELEQEARASLRAVQDLIDAMARQRRLWVANGMDALLADETVAMPGTFSRARWREIKETFNNMETQMATPLPGCGVPPLVVVSRRGNPPEPPTPEPPAEQTRAAGALPDVMIVGDVEDVIVEGQTDEQKGANGGRRNRNS